MTHARTAIPAIVEVSDIDPMTLKPGQIVTIERPGESIVREVLVHDGGNYIYLGVMGIAIPVDTLKKHGWLVTEVRSKPSPPAAEPMAEPLPDPEIDYGAIAKRLRLFPAPSITEQSVADYYASQSIHRLADAVEWVGHHG